MRLPPSVSNMSLIHSYGSFLLYLVRLRANRVSSFGTLFMRNRPQLELISRLSNKIGNGSPLKISVLACSKGAEVYSILWTIRNTRLDLKITTYAIDISQKILDFAKEGVYSLASQEYSDKQIFERLTDKEMREMFDISENQAEIKPWLKEGIIWCFGDAGDPEVVNFLEPQDLVVANNFLCHMDPPEAEKCLRNIGQMVKPGGYLVVSGIDLDVRTKVAHDLDWKPIEDLMEEIHDGDPSLRRDWPWKYWGLEPFNKTRQDWIFRYASVFQIGEESYIRGDK